jgi:hypothetical protein
MIMQRSKEMARHWWWKTDADGHVTAFAFLLSRPLGRIYQLAIPECLRDTSDTLNSIEATGSPWLQAHGAQPG